MRILRHLFIRKVPVNLFCGLVCIYFQAQSQPTFFKSYEGFSGRAFVQTHDGGFALAGTDIAQGATYDLCMMKTDSLGSVEWFRHFGGSSIDVAEAIVQTHDHGFVVAGYTQSYGAGLYDMYVIKTDSAGDTLWTRTFGGTDNDAMGYVIETPDSNLLFAGWTYSIGNNFRTVLMKTDQNGNVIWSKTYVAAGAYAFFASYITPTVDHGYMITGRGGNFYMLKVDSTGNVVWDKRYSLANTFYPDYCYCARQTLDSGFIISGGLNPVSGSCTVIELIKTDSTGNITWQYAYGDTSGTESDFGYSVDLYQDGSYSVSGITSSFGSLQIMLMKINPIGTVAWAKQYGSSGSSQECRSMLLPDSSFMVTSNIDLFGSDPFKMLRIDRNGYVGCLEDSAPVTIYPTNLIAVNAGGTTTPTTFAVGSGSTQIIQSNLPNEIISCLNLHSDAEISSAIDPLKIFPNPAHASFTLNIQEKKPGRKIEIFSSAGAKVYSDLFEMTTMKINCDWAPGVYHLILSDSEQSVAHKLIIF